MFVRSCVINEFDLDHDLLRNFIDYEKDTKDIDFAIRLDMAHHFSSYLRIPEFMRHFNEESDYSNYAKVNVDSHAKNYSPFRLIVINRRKKWSNSNNRETKFRLIVINKFLK